jgi:hypothetical protein
MCLFFCVSNPAGQIKLGVTLALNRRPPCVADEQVTFVGVRTGWYALNAQPSSP